MPHAKVLRASRARPQAAPIATRTGKSTTKMRRPAAIGVASLGVVAGRIVGQELHAYWRLHRVTRALAVPAQPDEGEGRQRSA